jgi:hypothetical protein
MRKSAVTLLTLLVVLAVGISCNSMRSDQDISTDIKAKLFSDSQLKTSGVDLAVKDGQVTLTGAVPNDSARLSAFKLASDTPGVKKVMDQMTVQTAEAPPAPPVPEEKPARVRSAARKLKHRNLSPFPPSAPSADQPPASQSGPPAPATPPAPPVAETPQDPPPPPPPQPRTVEIPVGTEISVRLIDSVDTEVNHAGESFHASLATPIVVDGEVVVPANADVYVRLATLRSAGRVSGQSEVALELLRLQFQGKTYRLISDQYDQKGTSRGKRTAAAAGGGSALGAIIGAAAGGGKGAAIGAVIGAAGGTGAMASQKGKQIKLPAETKLDFKLEQPVEITYLPGKTEGTGRRKP